MRSARAQVPFDEEEALGRRPQVQKDLGCSALRLRTFFTGTMLCALYVRVRTPARCERRNGSGSGRSVGLKDDVARWCVCCGEELCRDVSAQHNCETFVSWPSGGSLLSLLLTRQNRSCSGFDVLLGVCGCLSVG